MLLMDRCSLVYKGAPPDHCCCDAMLRILSDGQWITLFMTGGVYEPDPSNHVVLCRSDDEGESWGPPEVVWRWDGGGVCPSEAIVEGDRLVVFATTHGGRFEDWRNWTIESRDGGRTWGEPVAFHPAPRRAFIRNRFKTSWGEWILPLQSYDHVEDPSVSPLSDGSHNEARVGALITADEGATWEVSPLVGPLKGWAEPNIVELSDGRLVMLIRADRTGCLYRSESTDRGRTWTSPEATDVPNPGSKFRLFRLSDGRIALAHNPNPRLKHPNSKRQAQVCRNPLALWVSDDDMATWGHRRVLTAFPGMLAYPDGVVSEDEAFVHFAFDYNRHDVIYWGARLPER